MDSPPASLKTQRAQRVSFLFLFGERPKKNKSKPFGHLLLPVLSSLPPKTIACYWDELSFMFTVLSTAKIKMNSLRTLRLCGEKHYTAYMIKRPSAGQHGAWLTNQRG